VDPFPEFYYMQLVLSIMIIVASIEPGSFDLSAVLNYGYTRLVT